MLQLLIDICFGIISIITIILFALLYQNITGDNGELPMWIMNVMVSIIVILRQFKRSDT